jgi:glycosyltransferase involved in cell wall biosynthesis
MISLAMIVKDEEILLPSLLEHVAPYVAEIVIVDTGSTDHTVQYAREFTDKVYEHPLDGDFAGARNYGLERTTMPWILHLDADEWPMTDLLEWFGRLVGEESFDAALCLIENRIDGEPVPGRFLEWHCRFFRRKYRFIRKIHEIPDTRGARMIQAPQDLRILHYKPTARQQEQNARYATWT